MTIESDYLELMPDTITITPSSATDMYGKRTYGGTPTTTRGRTSNKQELLRDAAGREIVTTGRFYCYGNPTVSIGDRLTLPDGSTPIILSIDTNVDETGASHHTVLHYGKEV